MIQFDFWLDSTLEGCLTATLAPTNYLLSQMIKEKKWQYLSKRKAAWPHVLAEAQIQNLAHQHAVNALSAAK